MTQGTKIHTCECGWQGSEKEMVFRDGDQVSQWECPECLQVISNDLQTKDESKEVIAQQLPHNIDDDTFDPQSKEVKEGGELFTGGEWEHDLHYGRSTARIYTGEGMGEYNICALSGNAHTDEVKANAALIAQSKNMYYALKAIVDNWDQHMIGDKEQLKKNIEHDIEYWSPSASMINSEHIANARKILLKATPKK